MFVEDVEILVSDTGQGIAPEKIALAGDSSSWGWSIFSIPSKMAKVAPPMNSTSATTNAQK